MADDIEFAVTLHAAPGDVLNALMVEQEIRRWWTVSADVDADGHGVFAWDGYGWRVHLDMERDDAAGAVRWTCTQSNMQDTSAWEGTRIDFAVTPQEEGCQLSFRQSGYRESPCREVCDGGWRYFIGTSLKQYLETGKGVPYPETLDTRTGA
jgi:uncharacterized protein YndB with AHSA1/START domain